MKTLDGATPLGFAFGAMQFGGTADAVESEAMFSACRAAGITHFDTAFLYTDGASEKLLGKFAAPERERLLIASKVGYAGGAGRSNLLAQFDQSRRRLNMDLIDVLYLHRFDPITPLEETLSTFAELKSKGQIRFIGLSNFAAWQVMKAQSVAAKFDASIDIIQPMYSLVKRQAEVEILPMAQDQGIAVASYSPLGGGLLTGKYSKGARGRLSEDARYKARYDQDWMRQTAEKLGNLAVRLNTHPATLAVAWVAAHSSPPHPILSARNVTQLSPSLEALRFRMTPDLYAEIETLSQSPAPATDRLEET